jgi:hypothetical protein
MHERDDYEPSGPVVVTPPTPRTAILPAIARAIVSLTLLGVLLLAFGAAIGGYFLRRDLREDLAQEIAATDARTQLVVEYRNAFDATLREMRTERAVLPPPNLQELYAPMMERRREEATPWRSTLDLQSQIDAQAALNADIRWANERMRESARRAANPDQPRVDTLP